jgi:polyisoprenoid-binding protein YceI
MVHHVRVFTFKTGLLSRVAHDLRLHVAELSIERTGERVAAQLDPNSLVVDGAIKSGRLDAGALSSRDRATILANIRDEVLETRRYPTIQFEGTVRERDTELEVAGELELHGVRRPLAFTAKREGERIYASVTLTPSEFGIAPFKALAGAIRLQDRVVVELDLAFPPRPLATPPARFARSTGP